jgi:uncharacterized protein (DUF2141 family)
MSGVLGVAIAVSIVSMNVSGEAAPAPKDACLGVVASGFSSAVGHAILRLYRPGDDVTRPPPVSRPVAIKDGGARWCLDVGPGDYAVVVLHDLNDNGRVDHNILGIPAEPLGFSGGFRLGLLSGFPTFAKLRFSYVPGMPPVPIVVR